MDKFILPEYDNSIVSLSSSIRRYFELDVYHNTLSDIDKILEEYKPKNVVVILFDGMGSRLIKKILKNYWPMIIKMIYYYLSLRKGQNKIKQLKKISWQRKITLINLRKLKNSADTVA